MPERRTAGGPFGKGSYRTTSRWRIVEKQVTDSVAAGLRQLQKEILSYLHRTLHRWTGEMAQRAFVEVYATPNSLVLKFGSDAAHTFWHEVRYHPQLRETADVWVPKIGEFVRREIRGMGTA